MKNKIIRAFAVLVLALVLSVRCQTQASSPLTIAKPTQPATAAQPAIANPASENCVKQGGTLSIENNSDGAQFGVCYFEDNRQCEEWALLRGDCPVGGVKVTGYVTPAGRPARRARMQHSPLRPEWNRQGLVPIRPQR